MPKPWARLEQNYINHPKFLALTANAICLWHEGKNYCDMHQTDGMIPKIALKTFRWDSAKCVASLNRSCGLKPNDEPYAPLWEAIDIGGVPYFKMHDYLDHNDCRDAVLERLQDAADIATLRRAGNKDRQAKYRADRKAQLDALVTRDSHRDKVRDKVRDITRTCSPPTETETETETETVLETETERTDRRTRPLVRPKTPPMNLGLQRLKFWRWMAEEFIAALGDHAEAFDIEAWVLDRDRCETRVITTSDWWGYWQPEFQAEVRRRGLPIADHDAAGPQLSKRSTNLLATVAGLRNTR